MRRKTLTPLKPLLRRSPLQPNESLTSLLARLTRMNGYPSPTFLLRLCCPEYPVQKGSLLQTENLKRLAILTGIPADELWAASEVGFGQPVSTPNRWADPFPRWLGLSHTLVWYCPACLAEAAYHRRIWYPVSSAVCLHHTCLLMDGCPVCHRPVSADDLIRFHCGTCFADLRQAVPIPIPTDGQEWLAQTLLQSWQMSGSATQTDLPQYSPRILCRMADGLALGIAYISQHGAQIPHLPNFSCKFRSLRSVLQHLTPLQSLRIYATAIQCMAHWPEGFRRFLYWCEPDPKRDLEKKLKFLIFYWGDKLWHGLPFRFIWEAFHDFRADRSRFISGVADRGMTIEQLPAYACVDEAARILAVSREEILMLVEQKRLLPVRIWGKWAGALFFSRQDLRDWSQKQFCLSISETESQYL